MSITVENMTVCPPNGSAAPILKAINCRFPSGAVTLVIGRTGSGKSTLLNALSGLLPLRSGSIRYGELSLWNGSRVSDEAMLKTGLLFQYPERQLFAETIRKEFNYSLRPLRISKREKASRMSYALDAVGMPDSVLNDSFFTLSDGQKRKVAMATALAVQPDWLLLDEPTAGIDPRSVPELTALIHAYRQRADGGVIVVSHDLDTFLPVADRVLVLHRGQMAVDVTPRELCDDPAILERTGIGLPASLEISRSLREEGMLLAEPGLTPGETADAIDRLICPRPAEAAVEAPSITISGRLAEEPDRKRPVNPGLEYDLGESPIYPSGPVPLPGGLTAAVRQLHPLAKWLFYLAVSCGILLQEQWLGLAFAAILAVGFSAASGAPYRSFAKPAKPLLVFIALSCLIAGLTVSFGPGSPLPRQMHFSPASAEQTGRQLFRFLLMLLLSIGFAAVTGGQAMQRGLEQAFSFLERFRVPVSVVTFSASLVLKFIPMLLAEMERMSYITKARGKSRVKAGAIRLRDVPVFMIPLILSMMKHAEDLAFALEARGYKLRRSVRGRNNRSTFRRLDSYTVGLGFLLLVFFILIDRFNS